MTATLEAPTPSTEETAPEATPSGELDQAVTDLRTHKDAWVGVSLTERIALIDTILARFDALAPRWADACREAEGLTPGSPQAGEEWLVGPYLMLRNLRLLKKALREIERNGQPKIPGKVRTRTTEDGEQVVARVFPTSAYDFLFFPGVTADVWMEPGVTAAGLAATQAVAYHNPPAGKVALVLGAGNVSSIGPTDALYKFFVENQVVLYKMHPVNAYLGPLLEDGFLPLVEAGYLRIVYGDAAEGAYLCDHPGVDEIHITGSDQTVEAIAFGPGAAGARNKAAGQVQNTRRITAELGNVSAILVVPGPWSKGDIDYQAENIVSSLANNAGFNCNATRVVVTHEAWDRRRLLLAAIRQDLSQLPERLAYYPGAADRHGRFLEAHPEAERFGGEAAGSLPWAFIPGLDPERQGDICYNTEAFCGVFGETALPAANAAEFLDRAVNFANDVLWGTLNITLLVHPTSLRDPAVKAALERAEEKLRYGTISINHWAAVGFGLMTTSWGAYPGHDLFDVQSGLGVVHNTLMFDRAQKSVLRAPFKAFPKPPWFVSHGTALGLAKALTAFEAAPGVTKLPRVFWHGLRG